MSGTPAVDATSAGAATSQSAAASSAETAATPGTVSATTAATTAIAATKPVLSALASGDAVTLYFDATLSKLSLSGSSSYQSMPQYSGNSENASPIYCYYGGSAHEMTRVSSTPTDYDYNVYALASVPSGSTVQFLTWNGTPNQCSNCTASTTVPTALAAPCFFADTSDECGYNNSYRSGYWGEKGTIRDAGTGKGSTVVDIPSGTQTKSADKLYLNSTFYDYYTDYELNGLNRDAYTEGFAINQKNWVTFREFDQALSDYYASSGTESFPLYTGHFQPYNGTMFSAVAGTLNLSGYSNYNRFMAINNSGHDASGTDGKWYQVAQGLVASSLANYSNGDGTLQTNGGETQPHFNASFLEGSNSKKAKLGDVYNNVSFPFVKSSAFTDYQDGVSSGNKGKVSYWSYDSAKTSVEMKKDSSTGQYYLDDFGYDGSSNTSRPWSKNLNSSSGWNRDNADYGIFPFNSGSTETNANTYDYGFGYKLTIPFKLTSDGKIAGTDGQKYDTVFNFSGDDDVWVYVDGKLALDLGGDHAMTSGRLDFATKQYAVDTTVTNNNTHTNAGAKGDGTGVQSNSGSFSLVGGNGAQHYITLYYMERGMWESNMSVNFNFPDQNELLVGKTVDTTTNKVNDLFKGLFGDTKEFAYSISNQATHYGAKASTTTAAKSVAYSITSSNLAAASSSNTFAYEGTHAGKSDVAHYVAHYINSGLAYTDKRLGTISGVASDTDANGTKWGGLSFDIQSSASYLLSNCYLKITDANGHVASGRLTSGTLVGSASNSPNVWSTVKVSLGKLSGWNAIDSNVVSVAFEYDGTGKNVYAQPDFYLANLSFNPVTSTSSDGFETLDKDVADYGSVEAGDLMAASGALYSDDEATASTTDDTMGVVDSDGMFYLKDGETLDFVNQFRRGSYIGLTEELTPAQKALYATSYTVYEDGVAVGSSGTAGKSVTNASVRNLTNVSGTSVFDGRQENYLTDDAAFGDGLTSSLTKSGYANTGYTQTAYPTSSDGNTFVFRSYANPDTASSPIKISTVFDNAVRTGKVTVSKAQLGGAALDGSYTFYVEFYDVGGIGAETDGSLWSGPYTINTTDNTSFEIDGIPVGTQYRIHEVLPADGSSLGRVTEASAPTTSLEQLDGTVPASVTGADALSSAYVEGTAVEADETSSTGGKSYSYTFSNMKKPTVDLTLEKSWNGETAPSGASVRFGLYRHAVPIADVNAYADNGTAPTIPDLFSGSAVDSTNWAQVGDVIELTSGVSWKDVVTGLDCCAYDASGDVSGVYSYAIVELDAQGNPVKAGGSLSLGDDGSPYVTDYSAARVDLYKSYATHIKDKEGDVTSGIGTDALTATITNKAQTYALPKTGGMGVLPFELAGVALLIAALGLYGMRNARGRTDAAFSGNEKDMGKAER
jgi:fibro-slime domain-containing protein